jgi:phosphate/sulfate permease
MARVFNCILTAVLIIAAVWFLNRWFVGLESIYSYAIVVIVGTGLNWAGAEQRDLGSMLRGTSDMLDRQT